MHRQYEEDLFKDSTMTFGEHLEELRKCLIKALYGLIIGFIIGLAIGDRAVSFIQYPLQEALETYYKNRAIGRVQAELGKASDDPLPWTPEQVEQMVNQGAIANQGGLLPEEIYISVDEVLQELLLRRPDLRPKLPKPQTPAASDASAALPQMIRVFAWHPAKDDDRLRIKSFNAQEGFMIYLKASLLVGVLISGPWILYQLWSFVAAGLYPHEKRYVHVFLPFSMGLFFAGVILAFFFVFPPILKFLFEFNRWMGIEPDPRISEWLGFVLLMPLGFGIAFQMPLVMLFMERIGIFTPADYLSKWRIAILVMAVAAALLTPSPDPYSMLLMLTPLVMLYFGGIFLCKHMPRRRSEFDESSG